MRLAITGSRTITDKDAVYAAVKEFISEVAKGKPVTILSGGQVGVDTIVKEFASENGYDFILFEPLHKLDTKTKFNAQYFFIRNRQMVRNADHVFAIWDGHDTGTGHVINYADLRKVPFTVDMPANEEDYKSE